MAEVLGFLVPDGFTPMLELAPMVRPLESLAVVPDPLYCMVLVVRPLESRKLVCPPDSD